MLWGGGGGGGGAMLDILRKAKYAVRKIALNKCGSGSESQHLAI